MEQFLSEMRDYAAATTQAVSVLSTGGRRSNGQESIDAKTLQRPEVWKPRDHEEEMNGWPEWSFLFKSFMVMLDGTFERDLEVVERDLEKELLIDSYSDAAKARTKRLYSYLVSYTKGRPLRIVRAVVGNDGFRAWQHLCREFQPQTRQRTLCLLQAITQFPAFEKGKTLEGLLALEKLMEDYEQMSQDKLNNDLKVATLLRCCPQTLRQHLELTMGKNTTYQGIRDAMTTYEQTTSSWTTTKVLKQVQVYNNSVKDDPMEVDRVEKWKGKGPKGKAKGKGKEPKGGKKGKGKAKNGQSGWGKGKGDQRSGKGPQKGEGKGKAKETRECHNCGRVGHLARDCWSNDKKVRMVEELREETSSSSRPPSTTTSSIPSSSVSSSSSSTLRTPGMVRRIVCGIKKLVTPPDVVPCEIYDLAEDDSDNVEDEEVNVKDYSVCAILDDSFNEDSHKSEEFEAILDLGADISVLPARLGRYGEIKDDRFQALLRDAQGNFIQNFGKVDLTMLAQTDEEETIGLKENFVMANVKQPLVAVGKWLKRGWRIQSRGDGPEHVLVYGHRVIPLVWRGNSLAFKFSTKILEINYVVKLKEELEEIAKEQGSWIMEDGTPVSVNGQASTFQEPEVDFVKKEYPYRTTLVLMKDGEWHCVEYAEPRDHWRKGNFDEEIDVPTKVISIFHRHAVQPQGLGVDEDLPPLEDVGQGAGMLEDVLMGADDGRGEAGGEVPEPEGAVQAEEIGPRAVDGALADEIGEDYVVINGKRIEETTGLREMRSACQFLGIGKSGGKKMIFNRLVDHCKKGHSRTTLEISQGEKEKEKRDPERGPDLPVAPDEATQASHRLTHLPFESWCEECVATRSRDSERHERREAASATVSFDYMYTSTTVGYQPECDMLKHLVGVDSWTKAIFCLPIPGKGGVSLKRCVAGVTAFTRDHVEVILKGDGEPAMRQLLEAVQTTRAGHKLKTKLEYTPAGHHQSNPAERAIQTVRRLGNTLLEGVRKGLGSQLHGSHALRSWAYAHAAWLYNRFHVHPGSCQTAFEIATDRPYRGRLTEFGTAVYGQPLPHKPQQRKGVPGWVKAVFVGKLVDCDLAILSGPTGLFLSRGVRRCAQQWQPELIESAKALPWQDRESPGPKPGKKKKERDRAAMVEEVLKEYAGDEDAQAIAIFARQRAAEALHMSQGQAADGTESGASEGTPADKRNGMEDSGGDAQQPMEIQQDPKAEAGSPQSTPPLERLPAAAASSGGLAVEPLERLPATGASPGGLAAEASVVQQQTQQHFKRVEPEETVLQETPAKALKLTDPEEPPAKSSRSSAVFLPAGTLQTTSSTSSTSRGLAASPTFASNISRVLLGEEEVEVDEEFMLLPGEWGEAEEIDLSLWERTEDEGPPNLSDEEMERIDTEAETKEVTRLLQMGVLIPEDENNKIDGGYRKLTTKHVKDWRFRENQWQRRSRLVARDYKFLAPELEG